MSIYLTVEAECRRLADLMKCNRPDTDFTLGCWNAYMNVAAWAKHQANIPTSGNPVMADLDKPSNTLNNG